MVSIKFCACALPEDMDRDMFTMELMIIYKCVLNGIDGLEMTGMYADEQVKEVGNAIDFDYDVIVIRKDKDKKFVFDNKVQSQDGWTEILYFVQNCTNMGEILSGYIYRFFVLYIILLLDIAFWESGRCINIKVDVSYLRIVYKEIDVPYMID